MDLTTGFMSKPFTVSILLILIFLADLLSIRQTISFWQKSDLSNDGISFVFTLIAQSVVAVSLLACGAFIFYRTVKGNSGI